MSSREAKRSFHPALSSVALWSGLFLIATAALGFWVNRNLGIGTSTRMGPGYLPFAICSLMLIVGVTIALGAFFHDTKRVEASGPRAVIFVLGSIAFFAAAIETAGLLVAVAGLVLIGAGADRDTRWIQAILAAVGLSAFCGIAFVRLLGLPIMLWPALP